MLAAIVVVFAALGRKPKPQDCPQPDPPLLQVVSNAGTAAWVEVVGTFVSFGFAIWTFVLITAVRHGNATTPDLMWTYAAAGAFEVVGILVTVDALIDTGQGLLYTPGRWAKWRGPAFIIGGIVLGCSASIASLHAHVAPSNLAQPVAGGAAPTSTDGWVIAGVIVNALVALGAVGAAAIALWTTTSDRRERKQERDAEDAVQARMVIVSPRRPHNPLELQIAITNLSPRVIINLTFVRLVVEGHDFGEFQPTIGPFPVVSPPAASAPHAGPLAGQSLFAFDPQKYGPAHPYFIAVRGGPNGEPQTITSKTVLTATIRWTDASGKTWERTGSGPADASKVDLSEPVQMGA